MEIQNNDAYRYLLTLVELSEKRKDGKVSLQEIAARHGVHRTTVMRAFRPLQETGMLDEAYRLTQEGKSWMKTDGERVKRLSQWLRTHNIEEEKAEQDAMRIIEGCSEETSMLLSNIAYHEGETETDGKKHTVGWSGRQGSDALEMLYQTEKTDRVPVRIFFRKERGKVVHEVSMASGGFERTGWMELSRGEERLVLRSRPVTHQSAIGRWFEGRAAGLSCEHGGEWKSVRMKQGIVEIPLSYFWITYRNDGAKLRGTVRLRISCSVGLAAMPPQTVILEFRKWS